MSVGRLFIPSTYTVRKCNREGSGHSSGVFPSDSAFEIDTKSLKEREIGGGEKKRHAQELRTFRKGALASLAEQPYFLEKGSTKRKLRADMYHQPPTTEDESNLFTSAVADEPKAKRRYEEKMSMKLCDIHLRDDQQQQAFPQKNGPQSGPQIEEISDWDEELLADEDTDQTTLAPIIEEPADEPRPTKEQSHSHHTASSRSGTLLEKEEGEEPQRIVLSSELRGLIAAINQNQNDAELLSLGRPTRTGKELIPYTGVPASLKVMCAEGGSETEEVQADEIFDDEMLPDASSTTPHTQSDNENLPVCLKWSTTPEDLSEDSVQSRQQAQPTMEEEMELG